jgi:putative ABC transport system permease protein
MSGLRQDLRYAWRALSRAPAFTAIAVATLALGIGATTAIFSVLNGVVLNPLPYKDPQRIVTVWEDFGVGNQSLPAVSPLDFLDYRRLSTTFAEFAAGAGPGSGFAGGAAGVLTGSNSDPEQIVVSPVTANFFPLLGVDPVHGRQFATTDEAIGSPRVIILSNELWTRRYGGDASLVNRTIDMDGVSYQVIGVLPRGFRLHLPAETFLFRHADAWVPLRFNPQTVPARNYTLFTVFGRLKHSATLVQAQVEMDEIVRGFHRDFEEHRAGNTRVRLVPLQQDVVKNARPALMLLFIATAVVLLIACANVANLLVARSTTRRIEMAVRTALGATRGRLLRQMLTESALLAAMGGLLGLVLAMIGVSVLKELEPASLTRIDAVGLNGRVLLYAIVATLTTVVLFGLAPALHASGAYIARRLLSQRGLGGQAGGGGLRSALAVVEIALSLVLLVGAGLLLRSFVALQDVRPGFDAARVLTFGVSLVRSQYPDFPTRSAALKDIEARLRALPGVTHVGFVTQLPLTGTGPLLPYAYNEETARNWESATADRRFISPGYFAAMGTRLLAGRDFSPDDLKGYQKIIIDQSLADRAFPDLPAVGQKLQIGPNGTKDNFAEVIGVVEHMRILDLSRDVRSEIFDQLSGVPSPVQIVIRTTGDPGALSAPVHETMKAFNASLPLNALRPMSYYVERELNQARFAYLMMGLFAAVALTLAAIGIYGVMAYLVTQRTREIGIRIALGEDPMRVRRLVLLSALKILAIALPIGVIVSLGAGRILTRLTFGVGAGDPLTFVTAAALLSAVAVLASLAPAQRATRIDPIEALRAE